MQTYLSAFCGRVPYASELYGLYQPLLGWKARRAIRRFSRGPASFVDDLLRRVRPDVRIRFSDHPLEFEVERFSVGDIGPSVRRDLTGAMNSFVGRLALERMARIGPDDPDRWNEVLRPDALRALLQEVRQPLSDAYRDSYQSQRAGAALRAMVNYQAMLQGMFDHESKVAGALSYLFTTKRFDLLRTLFFTSDEKADVDDAMAALSLIDPMEDFDPRSDLDRVSLSPLGIVHLFRQYFYEFATFLGPPVQHLWLSPGGTVELVEVSTRRTLIERTTETAFESIQKTETSTTVQDDIADAVRKENQDNTKLGVSVNSSGSYGNAAIFTAQVSTGASYSDESSNKTAREETHKQLRQQSDKVSSEIKRNYKSTFRTMTETQDVSSKRYVLQNTSAALVNYELRRKMRQVGVQVQDYGTSLCWQTYVDKPGDELGIGKLVHIAEPADLSNTQNPDAPAPPEPLVAGAAVRVRLEWPWEKSQQNDPLLKLRAVGEPIVLVPPPGYIFERAQVTATGDRQWLWGYAPVPGQTETVGSETNIKSIFVGVITGSGGLVDRDHPRFDVEVTPYYKPSQKLRDDMQTAYNSALATAKAERERLTKEAMFKAARDRVKVASNIEPRKFEELREEERIVVYRNLIRQMLKGIGVETADPQAKHLLAELIQSIFDTDRMLYFVAPEWWVPRPIKADAPAPSPQDLGLTDPSGFEQQNVISWGGLKEHRPNNYFITEDSTPARLGSSLGWVIQLDGDNLRNAFLNAPWVKAVVPVRPGKELAALNWLTRTEVEGVDGLNNLYQEGRLGEREQMLEYLQAHDWGEQVDLENRYDTLDVAQFTLHDAIRYLALQVKAKYLASLVNPSDPADPDFGYLPTDRVFEKGFDPLQGGFKGSGKPFEVFDQWVEVLPTDQIVAVEVKYDPKTGLQI